MADIETDKASMAFEAQDEFYIAKIIVQSGVEVDIWHRYTLAVYRTHLTRFFYIHFMYGAGTSWGTNNGYCG